MTVLHDILRRKKSERTRLPFSLSLDAPRCTTGGLRAAIEAQPHAIIAEIKPASPSEGALLLRRDLDAIASVYTRHAQAISVLTDMPTFGGGFDLLSTVRSQTHLPLLAKDFFTTTLEIRAARASGADAVLLILAILSDTDLRTLLHEAFTCALDVLLEIHDEDEALRVIDVVRRATDAERKHVLIGINNRDLHTQRIDLLTTVRLAPILRAACPDIPLISESGIGRRPDRFHLAPHVSGSLIGTALLRSDDPESLLRSLRLPLVKFCGMTRSEDISFAEGCGVDAVGFVLVPGSPRALTLDAACDLRRVVSSSRVVAVVEHAENLTGICTRLQPDFVQIYEDIDPALTQGIGIIRAFRGAQDIPVLVDALRRYPFILLDKASDGTPLDLAPIETLPASIRSRLFIAGGLTPVTISHVVSSRPFAVDVARGIETAPGIKSREAMTAFLSHRFL